MASFVVLSSFIVFIKICTWYPFHHFFLFAPFLLERDFRIFSLVNGFIDEIWLAWLSSSAFWHLLILTISSRRQLKWIWSPHSTHLIASYWSSISSSHSQQNLSQNSESDSPLTLSGTSITLSFICSSLVIIWLNFCLQFGH